MDRAFRIVRIEKNKYSFSVMFLTNIALKIAQVESLVICYWNLFSMVPTTQHNSHYFQEDSRELFLLQHQSPGALHALTRKFHPTKATMLLRKSHPRGKKPQNWTRYSHIYNVPPYFITQPAASWNETESISCRTYKRIKTALQYF